MGLIKKALCVTALTLLSSTMTLSATETSKKVRTSHPVASAILMDAYRYLGALDKFSFDAITTNEDMYRDKMMISYTHNIHTELQRPNKLHIDIVGDVKNRSYYLFNDVFTLHDYDHNVYINLQADENIDKTLDHLFENFNIKTVLANLLYTDLDKRVAPKDNGYYFGMTKVDGSVCHHIGFTNETRELQVWIENSETPLIKKFAIIDKSDKFKPRSATILRWDLEAHFTDKDFFFKVPQGAAQISVSPASFGGNK